MLSRHETLNRDRCASMTADLSGVGVDGGVLQKCGNVRLAQFQIFIATL